MEVLAEVAPALVNGQKTQSAQGQDVVAERTYINVPYADREEVGSLGARWDREQKSWYIPESVDAALFTKWTAAQQDQNIFTSDEIEAIRRKEDRKEYDMAMIKAQKEYLAVPYGEKALASAAGALWDAEAKSWYKGPNGDAEKLKRWEIQDDQPYQSPAMGPREEFAEALRAAGCRVAGEHPIMDGQKHRIEAAGDRGGELSGFYVGHLDGRPAGYIKNNRTGVECKWKHKGYTLNDEEKAQLNAAAAAKQEARKAEAIRLQQECAERVKKQLGQPQEGQSAQFKPAVATGVPYLENKGITATPGTYVDENAKTFCVPVMDVTGEVWSAQYVREDGSKRFAKNGKKEGCFHPIGGSVEALDKGQAIIIAEGYATANTISQSVKEPVVAVFDSGNLKAVAEILRKQYPDKALVIAGDDDKHLLSNPEVKKNVGKDKAYEAARAVGAGVVLPTFGPDEQAKEPRKFTDFNDLANNSVLGQTAVTKQINAAIARQLKTVKEQRPETQQRRTGQATR